MIKHKVILVDDEQIIHGLLIDMFSEHDIELIVAENGEAGLEKIKQHPEVHLIITDYKMMNINGLEMLRMAREFRTDFRFILISGHIYEGEILEAMRMAACDCFTKPLRLAELLKSVQKNLRELEEEKVKASDQRQMIQQEKLMSLGELAAGMAHEVNNPNTYIRGNAETVLLYWKKFQPILDQIHKFDDLEIDESELRFMIKDIPFLLNQILDGTEQVRQIVEAASTLGHSERSFGSVYLNEVVDKACTLSKNLWKYDITLKRNYPQSDDPFVLGNQSQLLQVFLNLITNAAYSLSKSKQTAEKVIEISIISVEKEWLVWFRDNGTGFKEESIPNLFTAFFTTKPVGKGTGLGLSICKDIVVNHEGSITAYNHKDGGAVFEIRFPQYIEEY